MFRFEILRPGVVMDPLNPRECSGGHTEDKLCLAFMQNRSRR